MGDVFYSWFTEFSSPLVCYQFMHLAYCLLKVLPTAYLLCYLLCYPQYNLRSAWQVLSQSKTLFTAGLMYALVGKRLSHQQVLLLATGYRILTPCDTYSRLLTTYYLLLATCYFCSCWRSFFLSSEQF